MRMIFIRMLKPENYTQFFAFYIEKNSFWSIFMKTFKKILSIFLILTMSTGLITLSACGKVNIQPISIGDFTSLIVDKFGIETYQSEEPHVASVGTDSAYFTAVQGAYEWNIIEDEDDYNVSSNLSKEYCAVMLARAVGFDDLEGKTNEEVAQVAKDKGYITYDYRGRKDAKRAIDAETAKESLNAAFVAFADHDFGAPVEKITYNDDVVVVGENEGYTWNGSSFVQKSDDISVPDVDFGNGEADVTAADNEAATGSDSTPAIPGNNSGKTSSGKSDSGLSGNTNNNSSSGKTSSGGSIGSVYYPSEDTVAIPESLAGNIKEGTKFVVPSSEGTTIALTAEKVEFQDGYAYITGEQGDFEDCVSELKVSGTDNNPNLTGGVVRDGLGNVIGRGELATSGVAYVPGTTGSFMDTRASYCGKNDFSLNFSVGSVKITGQVKPNSIKFTAKGDLWSTADSKGTVEKSYEIKDIKASYDYDYSWFKLHSAYAQISYTTVDTTHGEFTYDKSMVLAPESNGNGHFLTNLKRSVLKDSNDKGTKSIKICSIPIIEGFGLSINLEVRINISISGEITVEVTVNNTKGIRYKENSGIEYIKDEKKDTKVEIKAKIELTLYLGLNLYAISWNLVGFGVEGGIGCEAICTVHLSDQENNREIDSIKIDDQDAGQCESLFGSLNGLKYEHTAYGPITLKAETCIDVTTYAILKFSTDNSCFL